MKEHLSSFILRDRGVCRTDAHSMECELLGQFGGRCEIHPACDFFERFYVAERELRRAADGEAELVIEDGKKSVPVSQCLELICRQRTSIAEDVQHVFGRAVARIVLYTITELQVTHREINIEHPA